MYLEMIAQIRLSSDTLSPLTPMAITQQKEFPEVIGVKVKKTLNVAVRTKLPFSFKAIILVHVKTGFQLFQ